MRRRGWANQTVALAEETKALTRYSALDLAADGSVAAELERWLDERELDMSVTGLSSYRDYIRAYVNPHIEGQSYPASRCRSSSPGRGGGRP
jgi:hypothetical protein